MLVKGIRYNVQTKETEEYEIEMELPDPVLAEKERQMQELAAKLREDDWKTIKYVEGALSEADWQAHIASRAKMRTDYNAAEAVVQEIKEPVIKEPVVKG